MTWKEEQQIWKKINEISEENKRPVKCNKTDIVIKDKNGEDIIVNSYDISWESYGLDIMNESLGLYISTMLEKFKLIDVKFDKLVWNGKIYYHLYFIKGE